VFAGAIGTYTVDTSGTDLVVTDNVGTDGIDSLTAIEVLRFNGVNYAVVTGTGANNNNLNGAGGAAGSQAVFGLGGNDSINGGAGNDLINAGAGTDSISQTGASGGRDLVNGGAGSDTYTLLGAAGAETFRIYTRAAAEGAGMSGLNATTEIVVTRNGTSNAQIVAELDNIEELVVNALNVTPVGPGAPVGGVNGGDTVQVFGDFTQTSLNFNTITVNGGRGNDTVDIRGLTSEHRLVFNSGGGHDTLLGTARPQDVIGFSTAQPSQPSHDMPTLSRALLNKLQSMNMLPDRFEDLMDTDFGGRGSAQQGRQSNHLFRSEYLDMDHGGDGRSIRHDFDHSDYLMS